MGQAHAPPFIPTKTSYQSMFKGLGVVAVVKESAKAFFNDDCMTHGAAIAYYSVFSLTPLLLTVIALASLVFGRAAVEHRLEEQIRGLVGPAAAAQVESMIRGTAQSQPKGILMSVVGIAIVLFG